MTNSPPPPPPPAPRLLGEEGSKTIPSFSGPSGYCGGNEGQRPRRGRSLVAQSQASKALPLKRMACKTRRSAALGRFASKRRLAGGAEVHKTYPQKSLKDPFSGRGTT